MHYYQFNIADYRKDTGHLTLLEHGIYRSLLDTYYLNEKPLCADHALLMRTHCVRTENEETALNNILKDFFILTKKGYKHKKCDEQISKYTAKSDKARLSAKARWDAKAMRTHSEGNANHKPITNNHKPVDQVLLPENLKAPMPPDFTLNKTNSEWIQNLPPEKQTEVIKDFIDYWILDESKKTLKGWQMAFRKNPIVKRQITNFNHNAGKQNGNQQQTTKPSLCERASQARKDFEQSINDEPMGETYTPIRS